jgi:hypothetical protein
MPWTAKMSGAFRYSRKKSVQGIVFLVKQSAFANLVSDLHGVIQDVAQHM